MRQKNWFKSLLFIATATLAAALFFLFIFTTDNKYTARLPVSQENDTILSENNLSRPLYLADGWELWPDALLTPEQISAEDSGAIKTFVGEYLNLSPLHNHLSPYGTSTWRLRIRYDGSTTDAVLLLPEVFCAFRLYINGSLIAEQGSIEPYHPRVQDTMVSFPLLPENEIVLQTANFSHYYSGLTYPPVLGSAQAVGTYLGGRLLFYGFLCFGALVAALFSVAHWLGTKEKRDPVALLFGTLALGFSAWVSYPFSRFLGVTAIRPLYAMEDAASLLVLWCALSITLRLCKVSLSNWAKLLSRFACSMILVGILIPLFILPAFPAYGLLYGKLITGYRLFAAGALTALTFYGSLQGREGSGWMLCGATLYGVGLLSGVLTVSSFEPARFGWMEEYGAFALVICFGVLMVGRSYAMLRENLRLNENLQREVAEKTHSLTMMVNERESLISRFLHDMKSPAAFMLSYSRMVRQNNVLLDEKTQEQLTVIEEKCSALTDRVLQVQRFTSENPLITQQTELELVAFLEEFYRFNKPDVEMDGQNFLLHIQKGECLIRGNRDKLNRLLQNLIYNAVNATPPGGDICITLTWDDEMARLRVEDTGCGISPEVLPRIFDQFFTTHSDDGGTGMGLYIVRTIAQEHGGAIDVESLPGKGTAFLVRLPLVRM